MGEPMKAIPAFREPGPRLELMDELGIDRSLMFPTLASLVEERMKDDPELIHVVVHALNEWMHETWSFNYEDRIFSTPVIALLHRGQGASRSSSGASSAVRAPSSSGRRRSPASAARGRSACRSSTRSGRPCADAEIPVAMHASDSGYDDVLNVWEPSREFTAVQADPVPHGRDGQASDRGRDDGAGLPRRADAATPTCGSSRSRTAPAGSSRC